MSKQWIMLLVSAGTDFVILTGTSLTAAMIAKGDAMMPTYPVLILTLLGGIVAFARTVQQSIRKEDSQQTTIQTTITKPTPTTEEPK